MVTLCGLIEDVVTTYKEVWDFVCLCKCFIRKGLVE